jgi:hypothetical protein
MRTWLVVNRRCGFRGAILFNAFSNAAMLVARSRTREICQAKMAWHDRICQSL